MSNLRTALVARNLRQVDLAIHTLKISPSVLSEIIRGRRKASAELRRKITEVLQTDEVWLVKPVVKIPIAGASVEYRSATDLSPYRAARIGEPQ